MLRHTLSSCGIQPLRGPREEGVTGKDRATSAILSKPETGQVSGSMTQLAPSRLCFHVT